VVVHAKSLPTVLLIEDSPDDIEFTKRALDRCSVPHALAVIEHGDEACSRLFGEERGQTRLLPDLILLDLNIPGMAGRDLLRRIKADDELRTTPVVVLSTSVHRGDVEGCYRLNCNSYHQKPSDLRRYQDTLQAIATYWLSVVTPPPARTDVPMAPEPRHSAPADRCNPARDNDRRSSPRMTVSEMTDCPEAAAR
jgi:CheY-like chemotaxis protein